MSFNTALSGLRAASQDLSVTGNNIANASTVGFKRSRTQFGDVYANSLVGGGSVAGSGVLVTDISQQFGQGNISFTDNSLDLAVNGQGFFVLRDASGVQVFTRAGSFGLDNEGFITGTDNARLQGNETDSNGVVIPGVPSDLQISTEDLEPALTQLVDVQFNLDSREAVPTVPIFDPTDPASFNASTSLTVFDSQGNPHILSKYFVKTAGNVWNMNVQIDDQDIGTPSDTGIGFPPTLASWQLTFTPSGALASIEQNQWVQGDGPPSAPVVVPVTSIDVDNWDPANGTLAPAAGGIQDPAINSSFAISIGVSTQFGGEFAVSAVSQDGFAPGRLASVAVSDTGVIFARYTNGEALTLGQLTLAAFTNEQGLTPLGNTTWGQSFESGQPVIGVPQSGSLGSIQSGALEESNVDLSEELVRLIIAQRNFQANAKTIETSDTVTQAIINLR